MISKEWKKKTSKMTKKDMMPLDSTSVKKWKPVHVVKILFEAKSFYISINFNPQFTISKISKIDFIQVIHVFKDLFLVTLHVFFFFCSTTCFFILYQCMLFFFCMTACFFFLHYYMLFFSVSLHAFFFLYYYIFFFFSITW